MVKGETSRMGNTVLAALAGVSVPEVKKWLPRPKYSGPLYRLYCAFTNLLVLFNAVSFGLHVLLGKMVLTERCLSFSAAMNCLQVPALFFYLWYRSVDFESVASNLGPTSPEPTLPWINTAPRLMFFSEALPGFIWCCLPLIEFVRRLHGGRFLVGLGLYPFDPLVSPNYEIVVLSQALCGFYISSKMISFYDTFLNLGSRMVYRYISLRKSLRLALDSTDPEGALRVWIREHQETIKLGASLQDVYSITFLIHLFFQLMIICTIVFVFVKSEMDNAQKIVSATYISVNALKVFLICRMGDHISTESDRLSEEGFGSRWYTCSKEVKNSLKIILARTNQNMQISAIGVFPLSSETFRSFIASAYSYYTFLVEMKTH